MDLNVQLLNQGFGSYLKGILPDDVAVAAGAFSVAMRQIRNIESVPVEKFAQIAQHIETTKGLDLINGTDVPTNIPLAQTGYNAVALGSGPNGNYTASDFFGSMSGLPYGWTNIFDSIKSLETSTLYSIYRELFLAVTWEKAYCTITVNPYYVNVQQYIAPDPSAIPPEPGQPRIDQLWYTVNISQGDAGGGYGRGSAPTPTVTLSPNNCGASVSTSIGTNDADANSNGGGTFGRVSFGISNGVAYNYGTATNSSNNNPPNQASGPFAPPVESITVQAPPTSSLGGSNDTGDTYRSAGSVIPGTSGWPAMNSVVQGYIDQANAEILSISRNNPQVTTKLNALWNTAGTQLTVEQRSRYYGIPPVPSPRSTYVSQYPITLLTFIDSMPSFSVSTEPNMHAQTLEAITDQSTVGGQSIIGMMRQERNQNRLLEIGVRLDNNMTGQIPLNSQKLLIANGTVPLADGNSAVDVDTGPWTIPGVLPGARPIGYYDPIVDEYVLTEPQDSTDFLGTLLQPGLNETTIITTGRTPGNPTGVVDTGTPLEPGALSKNPYGSLVPPQLNANYTSAILSPSQYSVAEAIDEVIKCNCDCWVD